MHGHAENGRGVGNVFDGKTNRQKRSDILFMSIGIGAGMKIPSDGAQERKKQFGVLVFFTFFD